MPPPTPATAASIDVTIHADHSLSGRPATPDTANARAMTSFSLDAPAGAELRVQVPEGVGMNGWAWANEGRDGLSFAKQGADWVTTTDTPVRQLSLNTSAFLGRTKEFSSDGTTVDVGDIAPRLAVNGVAQDAARPSVVVRAPLGWRTAAADGTPDAQRTVDGVQDVVVADRAAELGAATRATFEGRAPDGSSTTGPLRVAREAATRAGDAAATTAYTAMALLGLVP